VPDQHSRSRGGTPTIARGRKFTGRDWLGFRTRVLLARPYDFALIRNENVEPTPSALFTQMSPPINRSISLTR